MEKDDEARGSADAEATESDNGSVQVGFDFRLKTTRLTSRRLWLTFLTLGGAFGLILTVLKMIADLWRRIFD